MNEFIEVAGRRVHMSVAATFVRQLAQLRDAGRPVVLQDTQQALNTEQTSPAQVQALLDGALDQMTAWLESLRRPATGHGQEQEQEVP